MNKDVKNLTKIAINYRGQRETLVRQYFFRVARRFTPLLAVDNGDLRFLVATSEDDGGLIFGDRGLDEAAMEKLVGVLAEHTGVAAPLKDRVVLDIGGNIGTTSVLAVRRYGAKGVIAFEPAPANVRLLRINVLQNDVEDRVRVMPVALTDEDGSVELELSPENAGDHRVRMSNGDGPPGLIGEEHRPTVTVPAHRLDTLVAAGDVDLTDVGLIWMDVQGHEGHVLSGAQETMRHGIPVILEYWRYGLERAHGLDLLHRMIAEHFTRVIDMGAPWSDASPTVMAAADVAQLADRYDRHDVFADLLLLP